LVIVPGLMSGVSQHNPFHIMHSTIPLTWQLHHPSYGLCVPRHRLEIRMAGISNFHGKRHAHFWKVFTRPKRVDAQTKEQWFSVASQWRFWWGPLADHPPLPLGSDPAPRCYRRVIFGRELLRTGIGGFVTPRVYDFYRRYIDHALALAEENSRKLQTVGTLHHTHDNAVEWEIFRLMAPGTPRTAGDGLFLGDLRRPFAAPFYSQDQSGIQKLKELPFRNILASDLPLPQRDDQPPRGPDDIVQTSLTVSREDFSEGKQRWLNVLLVQRPKRSLRWIVNLPEVLQWVKDFSHPRVRLAVLVTDFELVHPIAQWQLAAQAHMLVGVTGAAVAWAGFLPKGGAILDLFPPDSNFCTEGWGNNHVSHYGGLARLAGVHHTCMVHPAELQGKFVEGAGDMAHQCRKEVREVLGGFWHGQNVRLDMGKFAMYFREAVDKVLTSIPDA